MRGRNILIGIVLLISIIFTSIVYAAFNAQLTIEGEAIVRSDQDIRITNISINNTTNGAYETYNNKYNKDTTFMYVTLPANSSIIYELEITNKSNSWYLIDSITQQSHTNSNVNVDISLNVNDTVNSNSIKTFTITLTNNTSTEQQENLVYRYNFYENGVFVTFDANGGQVSTVSKTVSYGSTYGTLPTPTRSGYTFKGWNGKNMATGISYENYTFGPHFNNRTSDELKFDENIPYFRINGLSSGYADTRWNFYQNKKVNVENNKKYYFSFLVRSKNSIYEQYISPSKTTRGYVGLYSDISFSDALYGINDSNIIFSNDGQWHKISFEINALSSNSLYLMIGIDSPNLCGNNSYIDISQIQLEEGNVATVYEPYYIENTTTVVQPQNHTLTAIWEEN